MVGERWVDTGGSSRSGSSRSSSTPPAPPPIFFFHLLSTSGSSHLVVYLLPCPSFPLKYYIVIAILVFIINIPKVIVILQVLYDTMINTVWYM
jgi:hypothetical protein